MGDTLLAPELWERTFSLNQVSSPSCGLVLLQEDKAPGPLELIF